MSTYSFLDVVATMVGVGGMVNLGYGSGAAEEGISIVMTEDKNTMTIGADGGGMHSLHGGKSGTVTVRLLKTSPVNSQLMMMYDIQSLGSATWGKNLITIGNTASGDKTLCRQCAFKKAPDLNYKKDGDIVEWAFDAIKIDKILGVYQ